MSVEGAVLLPWYRGLFTEDERNKARRRLVDQFDVEAFLQRPLLRRPHGRFLARKSE
jgi:hypothetical protein